MSQPARILLSLFLGLSLGIAGAHFGWAGAVPFVAPVGALWLDALRMTIVPLVVALLVTGIGRTADSARGGGLALRAVILFIAMLWLVTAIAAVLIPGLLHFFPMPADAAAALRSAAQQGGGAAALPVGEAPPITEFLRSIVPTNPFAAAAQDAMLPLIFFTTLFAVAVTRLDAAARDRITGLFGAIEGAMLVMVGWVLLLAPIGVAALAFVTGINAGTAAIGALAHYIAIVSCAGFAAWALAYPLAVFGGKVKLMDFIRAVAPAQAVALSTQSSLASLPAMLKGCERLGVPIETAGVPLPIAVAIFRVTSPAMNLAVAIYVAHWFGVPLTAGTIAAGAVVAAITTVGSVSLPGQISFLTSITPIAFAMQVPIEPLALLVAVEMLPDIVRTVGNVTMDVAATLTVARKSGRAAGAETA